MLEPDRKDVNALETVRTCRDGPVVSEDAGGTPWFGSEPPWTSQGKSW
jgi:hypothetical protein